MSFSPVRSLEIRPAFAAFVLALAYVDLCGIFWPFFAAAVLHELAHIAAIRAAGGQIIRVRLGFGDAQIDFTPLPARLESLCALAGPGLNALCAAALLHRLPVFACVSAILAAFNLLPLWPLDGGRVLLLLLSLHFAEPQARRICRITGLACCALLGALAVYAAWRLQAGLWVLLPAILPAFRLLRWHAAEKAVAFQPRCG